jgi:hypothetical protein
MYMYMHVEAAPTQLRVLINSRIAKWKIHVDIVKKYS